jgi:hypothetical protein
MEVIEKQIQIKVIAARLMAYWAHAGIKIHKV